MEYKKSMIIIILAIFLFSIVSVCASDVNDTAIASEDTTAIELSQSGEITTTNESQKTIQTNDTEMLTASDEETTVAQNNLDTLSLEEKTYADLSNAVGSGGNINLQPAYYKYNGESDTITITNPGIINGNGAIIDMAGSTIRAFTVNTEGVTINNLTIKNANYTGDGGAIYFSSYASSGTVENCNFTGNTATGTNSRGGAVYFSSTGNVSNCNFTNNQATGSNSLGGAVYFNFQGDVKNCNFVNNTAFEYGGAVCFKGDGTVTDCDFTNNKLIGINGGGGAVCFKGDGTVTDCDFTNNTASNTDGGAIYFAKNSNGDVTNCNFTNNQATSWGGAICFAENSNGDVTNCNFTNNQARNFGGAICFAGNSNGDVANCNFTGNEARYGGAIMMISGTVINCNFVNNTAERDGGAIDFEGEGTVTNCNFVNNTASGEGGAVVFRINGYVTNCNFTANHAATGSAIYFDGTSATKTVSNSILLNNRVNAEALNVVKNDNDITITFTGQNNLLNAIYSRSNAEVTFTNVTYWGAEGITNTGNSTIIPLRSNREAGQNITVTVVADGVLVLDEVMVTDENGTVVLNLSDGTYTITARHEADSYYTLAETTQTFKIGGLWSGLSSEIGDGGNITLKHGLYTYDYGDTIEITVPGSVIDGNGAVIDMAGSTIRAFTVNTEGVTINNLTIKNANYTGDGGAIYFSNSGTVENCNFTDNKATGTYSYGGAVYFNFQGDVKNCNFTGNTASSDGGAIRFSGSGNVSNCNFADNKATGTNSWGGAIRFVSTGEVSNCNFTNNKATGDYSYGGAIYFNREGTVTNCNFTDNNATGTYSYGGAVYFKGMGDVRNCNFTNNTATDNGGAIRMNSGSVENCNFVNNSASTHGGAVYFWDPGTVTNCNFTGNTATGTNSRGGAVYFSSTGNVSNCNFTNNSAGHGGAIDFDGTGTVLNCNFTDNSARNGGAVYFWKTSSVSNCNFTANHAATGSAIYFWSTLYTKTVSNSRFLNNRANAETLEVIKNDNNITITFTGQNNLLNAIYSMDNAEVTFNNVTYWGKNGITTISTTKSGFNKEEGQNITVGVVVNDKLVLSEVMVTDENGQIVLDIITGNNYYIGVRHDTDSYYTEAERTISNNTKFNVNVTSQTTHNRTVNITAKSNIPNEIIKGKLLFILPNGTQIEATYGDNGIWWAEHAFDAYGEYKINATYVGLDNVTINNGTITINKVNSTITLDNIVLDYGETKNVTVTTTGATGITAKIDGNNVTVINNYTIQIPVLDAGTYTLTVTTIPDDDHNSVTKEVNITVNKVNSTLTVNDIVFDYGSSGSTVVSLTGADGVNATVVGQPKAVVKVNGTNITVSDLDAGTYTLTVTAIADKNHNNITKNATITVNKVNATLTVNDVVLDYGESKNITVTTEGATGITAKIDGVNVTVSNYTIPISGLGAGNYTLTVTTIPDENHNLVTKEVNITVNKLSTEIILANETLDLKVGDEVPVLANLTPAGAGNLTFTSSNEDLVFVEDNVTIVANSQGQAIITVSFAGNENYTAAENKTITVNVALNDASVSVENDTLNLKVDETCAINATINPDTIMLHIKYTSSNESVATVDKNGIVTAVGEGRAIITLEVGDDEIYAKNSTTVTVTVNKINTTADVSIPENITVGDNTTVNVILPADATGNVTVKVDGEVVDTVPVKDGNADVTIPSMSAGNHTVEIAYSGDDKYSPVSATKDITVSKQNATADVTVPSDITVGDDSNVEIKLPSDATGNVTVKVDGEVVDSVHVTDGTANLTIPSLKAGNHTVEIAYSGDEKYNPASATKDITVSKKETTPEIDVEGSNVDVKLPSDATGNVTVKVDDTVVSTAPVTDGTASVKLPKLSAGNHTVEIAYSGDDKYKSASKTATISVDKDSTKLTADNVTATYKVDKYLTITLTDSKGNPLTNATVTVELSAAKNYTTDENGQVKVKVSNMLPKTYTAKITFAGNNNYLGSDATANVVVKKATPKITAKAKTFKTTTKTKKYTITLKDNDGKAIKKGTVYLKVGGKTYKATTNSQGKATFKITKLNNKGTYKATVTYKGNKYYNKATKIVIIKVKEVWKTVSKGSKDSATVKKIQHALKNHGYYLEYNGRYLKVDGIYWDYTEMAVKEFQKDKVLKVTGKVDEKTAKKLGII